MKGNYRQGTEGEYSYDGMNSFGGQRENSGEDDGVKVMQSEVGVREKRKGNEKELVVG